MGKVGGLKDLFYSFAENVAGAFVKHFEDIDFSHILDSIIGVGEFLRYWFFISVLVISGLVVFSLGFAGYLDSLYGSLVEGGAEMIVGGVLLFVGGIVYLVRRRR